MPRPRLLPPSSFLLASTLLLALAACGANGGERTASPTRGVTAASLRAGAATITGTVIDAASGAPVAGARVEGPGGTQTTSDAHGRFTLTGLPVGSEGELVARSDDGAEARNRLRPLAAEDARRCLPTLDSRSAE